MKHKNMYYDNRYKYKLNMLEPGLIMMKFIGVLLVTGILFWAAGWHWLSLITLFLAGAVFAVLLILLAIEAHQDKVLNEIAMWENKELEKKYGIGQKLCVYRTCAFYVS